MRTITNGTDDDGKSYVQNGSAKITSDTDDFGRTSKVTTKVDDSPKFSLNYTYKNVGETNRTTNNVHEMIYKLGEGENATQIAKYKYSYDSNGNITGVWENNVKIAEYEYDSLNQLKECADKTADKYFVYNYNNSGNITSIETYSLVNGLEKGSLEGTDQYSYASSGWKDQLVSYKNDSITYDNIGNPTSYRDGMTMSWTGRELQSITKGNDSYSFTYNLNGLRTKKNVNGTNTFYYYDDSDNLIGHKKGSTTVLFYYDSEGKVYSMTVGDDTYFFIKNLQGDVTKIIDENGTTVATYAYDAWGALLAENEDSSIEGLNPFRYRGYVYDTETELYYLQSRYYDPKTDRFINADDSDYTDTYSGSPLSTNMFAYCENNAVNGEDYDGRKINRLPHPVPPHTRTKKALSNFWGAVVAVLNGVGWKYSATFLNHSLRDKPSNLLYNSRSSISKTIAKSTKYKELISTLRKKYKNKWVSGYKGTLEFRSGDLLGALHFVSVTINEMYINGERYFQANISDKYDFKIEDYSGKWPIKIGNNLAVLSQELGVIVNYKIFIIINTKR